MSDKIFLDDGKSLNVDRFDELAKMAANYYLEQNYDRRDIFEGATADDACKYIKESLDRDRDREFKLGIDKALALGIEFYFLLSGGVVGGEIWQRNIATMYVAKLYEIAKNSVLDFVLSARKWKEEVK